MEKKCHFYCVTLKNRQKYFLKLNLAISHIGGNKKRQKQFFLLKCKNLGRRIHKPRNKKNGLIECELF